MGDITPIKILIVAVVALLVLGPEKLPEMTRKAGKAWADFKSFRANMEAQVRETVGDVPGFSELTKLSKLTNAGIKSTIASTVTSAMSMPTSAGSSAPTTSASAGPDSAGGATSASDHLASVSSAPEVSVTGAPGLTMRAMMDPIQLAQVNGGAPANGGSSANGSAPFNGTAPANGDGTADGGAPARPGRSRSPGSSQLTAGEPVFAADDPSFN